MPNIGYELDELGTNPNNKVTERRVLTSKVIDGRCFMIPKVTPFFGTGITITSGVTTLYRDIDYQLILHSPELSERLGADIYAGILFHKLEMNQIVDLTYQTPGGDFNLPITHTVEQLARIIKNPNYTTLSQIVGTPSGLPTFSHVQEWGSTEDYGAMVAQLKLIYLALAQQTGGGGNDQSFLAALQAHLTGVSSHTKEQVGLGNLQNYPIAQFSDFVQTTYPNNRYVTPRTVMYAINNFIGTKMDELQGDFLELENKNANTMIEWGKLNLQWEDLKVTLQQISANYTEIQRTIRNYDSNIQQINLNYEQIQANQSGWENTVNDFADKVTHFTASFNDVVRAQSSLLGQMAEYEAAYKALNETYTSILDTTRETNSRATDLEKHTMYPVVKVLSAGSYHFKIKPNEEFNFVLIGAGGGVGEFITEAPSLSAIMTGEHGGSTSLFCLTDRSNGEAQPDLSAIASAGGGFGGCSSYGVQNGTVNTYGIGGRGGAYTIQGTLVKVNESSAGDGGIKGYGVFSSTDLSNQDSGYSFFGKKWGKGANTVNAVGQGGEGAKLDFNFKNSSAYTLEMMVVVGARGRSYNPDRNNATGGLAIITKTNK